MLSSTCFKWIISEVVELRYIVGEELISKLDKGSGDESDQRVVRDCFTALMTCPDDVVRQQLMVLLKRLQHECW